MVMVMVMVMVPDLLADFKIILPGARRPEIPKVFLEPDAQIESGDIVPCGFCQLQRQTAVHSPAQQHCHPQRGAMRLAPGVNEITVTLHFNGW